VANKVKVDFPCGTTQVYDFDYTVAGNVLLWNGYALETILSEGDKIRVVYPI